MFFGFGRENGFPTQYEAHQTPVTVDVLEVGFIVAFFILFLCMLIFVPGANRKVVSTPFDLLVLFI